MTQHIAAVQTIIFVICTGCFCKRNVKIYKNKVNVSMIRKSREINLIFLVFFLTRAVD